MVEAFLLAFDSNHAPMVGQQVTLDRTSTLDVHRRIDLMIRRADAGDCDLVAKAGQGSTARGYRYVRGSTFTADEAALPAVPEIVLRFVALFPGQETTYTCVPLGSGRRIGTDCDADGVLDGDEGSF